MMSLRRLAQIPLTSIPAGAAWVLADLGEARGKQELHTRQSPQRLAVLREHAIIESAISSSRIEGVTVEPARVGTVLFGKALLHDRAEEEVRGYREALRWLHEQGDSLALSEETICELHRLVRGGVGDAGTYKARDSDIIERYPDGRERIRFRTVPAAETPRAMRELVETGARLLQERDVHPLVIAAALNLDFLCIHPFRDGNGRVSRLLLLLECYRLGYEVGRYISLERLIEEHKERYYETLEQSSQGWHEGRHDLWPYTSYLLFILKNAYRELEQRLGQVAAPRGAKTELIEAAIDARTSPFSVADLERACPGVSRELIRKVLQRLQRADRVECTGRGPGAAWRKKG
jgi:Fic family protein